MLGNNTILLILLAIAAGFLFLKLRSILGTRTGFEDPDKFMQRHKKPEEPAPGSAEDNVIPLPERQVEEDDSDIFAVTEPDSALGRTLKQIKAAETNFNIRGFIEGSKSAYEMLLTSFEAGDKDNLQPYLSEEVYEAFSQAIDQRNTQKLSVDMRFIGFRTAELIEADFETTSKKAEMTMRFVAELVTVTRNEQGDIVEGDPQAVQKVTDIWTFSRNMGSQDPNWILVATGG